MKKILMIVTSHKELENTESTTGVWLGEFTDPYFEFLDKGYEVTVASPKGGEPPVDPRSRLTENISPSNRRFDDSEKAQQVFRNTRKLSEVNAADFDALFYPGGHGPMWDLSVSEENAAIVLDFYRSGKPIGAICHGPAALITAAAQEPALLEGKEVTSFSNVEEKLVMLYENIPFKLEDRLKELGGKYDAAAVPFTSKVRVSGKLVTGQNPASANQAAKELINLVEDQK